MKAIESFGHGDVIDTINLITLVQSLPQADASRTGMMGSSRGGMVTYMVLKAESESGRNRIRCAVTVGGVADLIMWVNDNPDLLEILTVLVGPPPSQAPELYQVRSATYWPGSINVPLLLLHGGNDWTVLPSQSQKLYDALKAVGRDVTLVIYPGDDHQLNGQLSGFPEAVRFFGRHFQTGTDFESNAEMINLVLRGITGN